MYMANNPEGILDLTLTDNAVEQVKKLLVRDDRQGYGLRVAVTDGGCSGHSYKLDFDKEQQPGDTVLEYGGVKVFVDRASLPFLQGMVIDFASGLYGGGFKFSNPNATATCGCGTSFSA
ncbi:MAG TPA: iron-sulfur cluster assembly accessory protein [Acidobacteriota bacterium]|nr:iron-sulfur cluster assembly accessory protein [Acidobacteriota bacterium]